ncbi:serpin B4-like [Pangshura tecta]
MDLILVQHQNILNVREEGYQSHEPCPAFLRNSSLTGARRICSNWAPHFLKPALFPRPGEKLYVARKPASLNRICQLFIFTMSSISEATTKFCLDFFKVLNEDRPSENIIHSPLSISAALGMVLLGARGNTATQMEKVLNYTQLRENENPGTGSSSEATRSDDNSEVPDDQCDIPGGIHSQFHDIFSAINKPTTSYELANANRLYGEQTFQFLQPYLSCIQKLYQAELKPSDFLNAAEETREQINLWVETFTKGKIKDLFAPGTLSADTVLVLVNAVYFKGQWAVEFEKENTRESPFQINKTTSKPVKMMCHIGKYKIATIEEHDCQVLELPYKGGDLSMYILLPKDYAGLTQLEKELTYEKLTTWISPDHLKEGEVEVALPQFKIETSAQLNQYLEALGMTDVFRPGVSDLSGMAKAGGLFVSQVVHKAYIEVNEEGTVATAATGDEVTTTSARIPVQFVADHPFLFFIRHQKTKCILFYGRFSSP